MSVYNFVSAERGFHIYWTIWSPEDNEGQNTHRDIGISYDSYRDCGENRADICWPHI